MKLSFSFSVSHPSKLALFITINHFVHFGLITMDTDSLEIFVLSHYPFWTINNFTSEIVSFYDNQWKWLPMRPHSPSSSSLLNRMLMHMRIWAYIFKNCGELPNKPVDSSGCASAIELSENNGSSNQMTEDMARDCLNNLFQPLISQLCEEKGKSKDQGR